MDLEDSMLRKIIQESQNRRCVVSHIQNLRKLTVCIPSGRAVTLAVVKGDGENYD